MVPGGIRVSEWYLYTNMVGINNGEQRSYMMLSDQERVYQAAVLDDGSVGVFLNVTRSSTGREARDFLERGLEVPGKKFGTVTPFPSKVATRLIEQERTTAERARLIADARPV